MFTAKHIINNNDSEKAIEELGKISAIFPKQYYIEFYQALCHLDMEQPDKALLHLEAAIKLNPAEQDIPSIYSYTGVCLKDLGEYEKALDILKKGIKLDNQREDIFNLMGFCNFMLKRHQESISCFENVLKLKPGSGIDHASIASNYRELGQTEKAINYYKMALVLDPSLDFAQENIDRLKKQLS